jgi:peroxiredoxin family protein
MVIIPLIAEAIAISREIKLFFTFGGFSRFDRKFHVSQHQQHDRDVGVDIP